MSATAHTRMPVDEVTAKRKDEHLDLCATGDVVPRENSTLFEQLTLMHCALPEISASELELTTPLFGKRLKVPLLVTGMTGGTERAMQVNRDLAGIAEEFGAAFGVGSQRAMAERPELTKTFSVRDVAPSTVILGNIGVVQAVRLGVDGVTRLFETIRADAMAIHLNPGQELTQPEGDRDFRGGVKAIEALVKALGPDRVLVKETGCGISPQVARRLVDSGVRAIDVSGLGGTSWVRVEQLRAGGVSRAVGEQFSSWGIPTAAAIGLVRKAVGPGVTLIASGGIRTGLDVAKAFALGADVGGMALPLFRAHQEGGVAKAREAMQIVLAGLKQAMVLTGSKTVEDVRRTPRVTFGALKEWLASS